MLMTRFEYFIRRKKEKLSSTDLYIINRYAKSDDHPILTAIEKEDALYIIKYKEIDVTKISFYFYFDNNYSGLKRYNCDSKSVKRNLSKEQWLLLIKYYKGYTDNMDIKESDNNE